MWLLIPYSLLISISGTLSEDNPNEKRRVLPVFSVVNFQNTNCRGLGSRNGTCYTQPECMERGGEMSGRCAGGFGVCCIILLSCGGTSADNCTYIEQGTFTSQPASGVPNPCRYRICQKNNWICRIRLDFSNFVLAPPVSGTVVSIMDNDDAVENTGGALGDCSEDSFTFTSPGNQGAPVICGFNTGQHMILDASPMCNELSFNFGNAEASRSWSIKVTQYSCGDTNAGPIDCLQYFTGQTGVISSFNYNTAATAVSATAQHLSDQCYTICIRQEPNTCSICYSPATDAANNQSPSFGLSVSSDTDEANNAVDNECTMDFLVIPNLVRDNEDDVSEDGFSKICGTIFGTSDVSRTLCTLNVPYRVTFKTDSDEQTADNANTGTSELVGPPGGTVGFSLFYNQIPC